MADGISGVGAILFGVIPPVYSRGHGGQVGRRKGGKRFFCGDGVGREKDA